jgi:hypothetical protein
MRHERLSSGHFRREPYLPEEAARGCGPWPSRVPARSRVPANQANLEKREVVRTAARLQTRLAIMRCHREDVAPRMRLPSD